MSLVLQNISELEYDKPTKDGEFDAMLVKTYVEDAEEVREIPHGLGRVPQQVHSSMNATSDSDNVFRHNRKG